MERLVSTLCAAEILGSASVYIIVGFVLFNDYNVVAFTLLLDEGDSTPMRKLSLLCLSRVSHVSDRLQRPSRWM